MSQGTYTLTTTWYSLVAVFNDLHAGRHAGTLWSAVIDVAAVTLAFVALTGLVLEPLIPPKRRTATILLIAGLLVSLAATLVAT